MGKRLLNLYVEDSDVALAKSLHINLSEAFREFIKAELMTDKNLTQLEQILLLKSQLTNANIKINQLNTELEKLKEHVESRRRIIH